MANTKRLSSKEIAEYVKQADTLRKELEELDTTLKTIMVHIADLHKAISDLTKLTPGR